MLQKQLLKKKLEEKKNENTICKSLRINRADEIYIPRIIRKHSGSRRKSMKRQHKYIEIRSKYVYNLISDGEWCVAKLIYSLKILRITKMCNQGRTKVHRGVN